VLKGKNLQPRILYPAKLSFRERVSQTNKEREKEFPRQTKVKGVHDDYTSPIRYDKCSVTGKERL